MKKTATLLVLAGLSMAAHPEHLHGSFRNNRKPVVDHKPSSDPYVASNQSETLNADDELLLIYKPQYDVDPGMVIRPPRGVDIDPGMIIRPPRVDIDNGIFIRPRPYPQVMYADDELAVNNKGLDSGMVIKPRRGDVDPKMIMKPLRGDFDPKIILNPKKDVMYADDEFAKTGRWGITPHYMNETPASLDDELMVTFPRRTKPTDQFDDEFALINKEVGKGLDSGMVIKPRRGDVDPKMVIKPKRGDFDPKIILNPKKDIIYTDDELVYLGKNNLKTQPMFLDDELMVTFPRHIKAIDQFDDEFSLVNKEAGKGLDSGMVIKPRRGDVDPKMVIKPKRGDFDPKIILNPKKDVIYTDDELVYLVKNDLKTQPIFTDDELVYLVKNDLKTQPIFTDDELMVAPRGHIKPTVEFDDEFALINKEVGKGLDSGMVIKPRRGDVDPKMVIKPKRGDFDPKIILNPKKDVIYTDDELVYLGKNNLKTQPIFTDDELMVAPFKNDKKIVFLDDEFSLVNKEISKGLDAGMVIKPRRGDIDPKIIINSKRGDFDPKIILNPKKDVIYTDDEMFVLRDLLKDKQ